MPTWSDEKYFVHGGEDDPTKCQDPKDKRIAELEAAVRGLLNYIDAGRDLSAQSNHPAHAARKLLDR